jgi:hypothetical protein
MKCHRARDGRSGILAFASCTRLSPIDRLPSIQRFLDRLRRMCLADRHEFDFGSLPTRALGGGGNGFPNGFEL